MSRHRIVRTMDYNDEYDGYDDIYGHSVDDDSCISPTDASQWIYDRARGQQSISAFMANHRNIEEENEDGEDDPTATGYTKMRRDSENFQMPVLDDLEQAKLMSCIDEIRSVVGDSFSERQIVETAMKYDYDVPKSLDAILNASSSSQVADKSTVKPVKDPSLEKDFVSRVSESNTRPFVAVQSNTGCSGSSNNIKLTELIKTNLPNCKISESPSKSGFFVPKLNLSLGGDKNVGGSSKLNQFVSDQLSYSTTPPTSQQLGNIIIPKLSSSSNLSTSDSKTVLTPLQLSLLKIKESKQGKIQGSEIVCSKFKNLNINEHGCEIQSRKRSEDSLVVDLTKALSSITTSTKIESSIAITRRKEEIFFIPFIDCDLRSRQVKERGKKSSDIKLKKKPTHFGKVVCLKYRCTQMPYVKHIFESKHPPKPFKFESKSPDDIILEKRHF